MKLRNSVNGNVPFEGDRTFRWQAIPANAKILSAVATVTPVDSKLSSSPFTELLSFRNGTGDFGATRASGTASGFRWVEVDLHSRRTLAGVTGGFGTVGGIPPDTTGGSTLQVDVGGGTYVEINQNGAFRTPSDPPDSFFLLADNATDLPGLTVAKLKATSRTLGAQPSLTTLMVRSVPTQVSLRVGELPPFWTHVGEMTLAEKTSDFSAVLQAALTTATIKNGFYDLPVTVHSDSIARLKIELEIEVLAQQDVLSPAVPEIVLPFDVSTLAKSKAAELKIEVPANSRVVPGATSARVQGAFAETRIAHGPTGQDNPLAAIEVSPTYSQAQVFRVGNQVLSPETSQVSLVETNREIAAVAVDLLLEALTPSVKLRLDIRGDFDGKPDEIPLLPAPVEFGIDQLPEKGATWTSVVLPSEFLFAKATDKPVTYWLLLQSVEGRAAWSVEKLEKDDNELNIQRTEDGGLSWKVTSLLPNKLPDAKVKPPFVAFFRLREKPKTFKMPIKLQVGSDDNIVTKTLERFEPLGRVDFTLDTELAEGINEYLADAAVPPPETEHLLNTDFEKWTRIGQEPLPQPLISLRAPVAEVAFSPDGSVAYVLSPKPSSLLIVDASCNKEKVEKAISLTTLLAPNALVISPDGTRAYATNGGSLRVVDLVSNQAVGEPFSLDLGAADGPVNDLAISPDGRVLYAATLRVVGNPTAPPQRFNRILAIDTAKLEQQLTTGVVQSAVNSSPDIPLVTGQALSPAALAVSPDGSVLYLVIDLGTSINGVVMRINTNTLLRQGENLPVGTNSSAIALSPNGKVGVVTNTLSQDVSIIDTAAGSVVQVPVEPSPIDVAISPDSARAYVLLNTAPLVISVIDLGRNPVPKTFASLTDFQATAFALAPAEDHIYAVTPGAPTMGSIQVGKRVPSEWQLTSGEVRPLCFPDFHQVALMGAALLPTSLSQVVPVAELYPYEFSFWGIAVEPKTDEPPAIAEVLWLNSACGLLQRDSLPIELIDVEGDLQSLEFFEELAKGDTKKAPLVFHRLTTRKVNGETQPLIAPAGAKQAEVRFSVGKSAAAAIDLVSLSATSDLVANGDFKLQKEGELIDWTLVTEMTGGFSFSALEEGLRLSNAGGATVELVQTVTAESEQPFMIEFQGKASASSLEELPRVELHWIKANGSRAGEPAVLEIQPDGLDSAIASGTVPKDSSEVEIHIVAPSKTTIEVKRISLKYPRTTKVPVKFISEAPGDMTVSDVRVSFEEVPPQAPPLPKSASLCTATPPSRKPGQKGGCCYCHKCEEETVMTDVKAVITEEGRPAAIGKCSTCRTSLLSAGGPADADAKPLPLRRTMVPRPVVVRPLAARLSPAPQADIELLRLTDIRGIGAARAKQLEDIGIDSVEKLAAATPAEVAQIKFITARMALQLVEQAKSLIRR